MLRQRTAGRYYLHDLLREHARAKVEKELDIHDDPFGYSASAVCVPAECQC
jgi:hypothetical protein